MINSSNLTDRSEQWFRGLAFLTVLVVYLLILAGGIVRGTGSGMGCPDWPTCFGRWIPPTKADQLPSNYRAIYGAKLKGEVEFNATKTWIEYVNRLLGVFSGFLVFATLLASLSYLRKDKVIFWGSLAAFLLIGANGWLGSRVVASELAPYLITLHLLLAILVVFALLFVLIRSTASRFEIELSNDRRVVLSWIIRLTMIVSLVQVLLGTQVRDALDEVIKQLGYSQRENWVGNLDWRFYTHRSFSLVVLALHAMLIYQLRKTEFKGFLAKITIALAALVIIEIMTGALMGYFAVPAAAQPVHLFLAISMLGAQFVIFLLLRPNLFFAKPAVEKSRLLNV